MAKRHISGSSERNVRAKPSTAVFMSNQDIKLSDVRDDLIRQEETIIFALIERAQFAKNLAIYARGDKSLLPTHKGLSYLDMLLNKTEETHALVGRFTSPDENPFFVDNSKVHPLLPPQNYPVVIKPNTINYNDKIWSVYQSFILPGLDRAGGAADKAGKGHGEDDGQYGSSAVCDIAVLQALSKRIHFGKFVAEAKFRQNQDKYAAMIRARDAQGLMKELTKPEVEAMVIRRVQLKASTYGKDPLNPSKSKPKVGPEVVASLYRDYVMPLNKEVQVEYLLQRLAGPTVAFVGAEGELGQTAAKGRFGDDVEMQSEESVRMAFAAVLANRVAHAVVPLYNQGGVCSSTLQELLKCGLNVTGEFWPDDKNRFVVVSKNPREPTGQDTTLVYFRLKDSAGALAAQLQVFAKHGVNLTFIQSLVLPDQDAVIGCDFLVEADGHNNDKSVQACLEELQTTSAQVRWLGSFMSTRCSSSK